MKAVSVLLLFTLALAGCVAGSRTGVLTPDASTSFPLMDFSVPMAMDPPPPGWFHRKFLRYPPMDISFASKDGRPAIRLATSASASMLFRHVDVPLDAFPALAWDWLIEQPIESDLDETTIAGDDHPARLFLKFESREGDSRSMEIIWGNRKLRAGDWKFLDFFWGLRRFPHYVANGGDANAGRWLAQEVDMRALYRHLWGDPGGARLVEVALFCDTDQTRARSVAWFSGVRVNRAPRNAPAR